MFGEKTVFRQQVVSLPRVRSTHTEGSKRFKKENSPQRYFSSQKQNNNNDTINSGNKINRCNTENPSSNRRERSMIDRQLLPSLSHVYSKSPSQHPKDQYSPSGKERLRNLKQNDISIFSEEKILKPTKCYPSSPAERNRQSPFRRILTSPSKPSTKEITEGLRKVKESGIGDSRIIGEGNFGVVYKVSFKEAKEDVAVKRVLQDKAFKNREIQIMLELQHPNIVALKHSFLSFVHNSETSKDHNIIDSKYNNINASHFQEQEDNSQSQFQQQIYLNIVMEYIPSTLVNIIKFYHRFKPPKDSPPVELFPGILIKLYLYQALRALAYLQGKRIAHRDLKPSNILINHRSHALKLCDFGSAKHISQSERSLSYICSRNYRAPEMLLGSSYYDETVDIWALGCIIVEMIIGEPLFQGQSSLDQLVEIMKVLGTPSSQQIKIMNPDQKILHYPPINKIHLSQVLENYLFDPQLLDLLEQMIVYEPYKRIKPLMALMHPIFNELRIEQCRINGKKLPILFDFTIEELATVNDKNAVLSALTPHWYTLLKQTREDKSKPEKQYEVSIKQKQQQQF